ncbi:histidine phosphatase family protein [Acetobacter conturbans]|uniref:Histidine phosphatase family protein n=1 Tax=Acetobacter conturbans TaxID=1737472 RepID=A0ABX0JZM3_9PROT|nr:histidine phosphatase family protein [Acetobacter conturbans]NHN88011.1 histidine phosphatase family protein [Acetobacter conturbans]
MIVLRHCQSEFNRLFTATRKDPGIPDPPLSDMGQEQARKLVAEIGGEEIRHIIVSPYKRAIQTAMPIAKALDIVPVVSPLIRERAAFSCDVGSPRAVLAQEWPALDFSGLDEAWWSPVIETPESVEERAELFRSEIAVSHDWERTLVVSHWAFLLAFTRTSLENGSWLRIDPTRPPERP